MQSMFVKEVLVTTNHVSAGNYSVFSMPFLHMSATYTLLIRRCKVYDSTEQMAACMIPKKNPT